MITKEHIEILDSTSLETIAFGIFRIDQNGQLIYANRYLINLLGYRDLSELNEAVLTSNDLQKCFSVERISTFIRDSQKTFYEYRWPTKNKTKILLREFGHEIIKENNLVYFDCVVENISERSLVDNLLSDLKSSDYSILKAIPDHILIVSQNGEIVEAKNHIYNQLKNKNKNAAIMLEDIFEHETAAKARWLINKTLQTGEPQSFDFKISNNKDDKYFEARFSIRSYDETLMILRDITSQKLAEQQVKIFTDELQELNNTKDKFFSIIGHDLRTPINGLLNYADILVNESDELSKEEIKEFAGYIGEIARTTSGLLSNLLEWSRIQTGKISFDPQAIELNHVVEKVFRMLQPVALNKQVSLINSIPYTLNCIADGNMLQSIILNLSSNAIKFSNTGGIIEINATDTNGFIQFSVRDNGIGIKESDIEKVFNTKTNFTTLGTAKEKGTGLGLMLCKEFVKMHGGNIWVESTFGLGTTFYFTLKK